MKVIVDAFGGDNAPLEVIRGAAQAVEAYGHDIVLTGDEAQIRKVAADNGISLHKMDIIHAPDVIGMDDEPRSILKEHKECSMAEGLRQLAAGNGDAFVTAGSTGAMIMGSTFIVKRIKGVSRAALAPLMPSNKGPFMLIDSGANVDCRPEMLLQFAKMGSLYMQSVMGRDVSVGLINIGVEDCKGGALQHEAFALLKDSGLNFVGNVEARDIPFGTADVLVADGFTGNVMLKSLEGTAKFLLGELKKTMLSSTKNKMAAAMLKGDLANMKRLLDPSEIGGTAFLGISKPVIKAHGSSNARAISNAILRAKEYVESGLIADIERDIDLMKVERKQEKM